MARVRGWQWVWGVALFCVAAAAVSRAQVTVSTLVDFDGTDGRWPTLMDLTQGADGNFYGVTLFGGDVCPNPSGCGTVFKMTPAGTLTTLYEFCAHPQTTCPDGYGPLGTLVQATNGDFYGVTSGGGNAVCSDGCGTIFKITRAGVFTTLYSFCARANCADGNSPFGGLVQATNGNFYGTTELGNKLNNTGTVFEITPTGKLTTLYSFCSIRPQCADGSRPGGALIQATDGNFYGETTKGGASDFGTIFEITPTGKLTTIHSFNGTDGSYPSGGLIQAVDGDFYGVTPGGGTGYNCGDSGGPCGTVFEITSTGALTTLYDFCTSTCADGAYPYGPLVQATDGNFYGTTYGYVGNGPANTGTLFEISSAGTLTTLFTFGSGSYGFEPEGGLVQATNGIFYGTTVDGGPSNNGTIFSLTNGLGPFVSFIRNPAKVGQQFGILGYGLTGTSSVLLNGIAAKFTTESDTLLIATVPAGATTGSVTVTTPSGTLTSNVPFRVIP